MIEFIKNIIFRSRNTRTNYLKALNEKIFLSVFLVLSLNAQNLEIDKIRTDLYSKSGTNVLKKSKFFEFDGNNLKENENKLIDAVNTVISGFFTKIFLQKLEK